MLVALIPVPAFVHPNKRVCGVLEGRMFHQCISIVVQPLKKAAEVGVMMNDPTGYCRYCFTPLVSYIADTPEELLVACVCSNVSPVTTATRDQFGDAFRHPLRKGSTTIARINAVVRSVSPAHVSDFFTMCKKFSLNGVHEPFWQDWALSDPSSFIIPEILHHIHRMFWDHDLQWGIFVVGAKELDFRFMLLQVPIGYRGFGDGVSTLKQVSGRDHRHIQRYFIGLIAAAVPSDFLSAIRSLCEFRYLAQAPSFTDGAVAKLERALKDFHSQKDAVLISGARRGKSGEDKPWAIPKLELLQGVAPSIRSHGSPMQWSADPTERAHIDYIKIPGRAGNKHDYDEQICRHLDRQEKCENFTLAMKIKLGEDLNKEDEDDHENASVSNGGARQISDYFQRAQQLEEGIYIGANPPKPFRTFATSVTAYHLNNAPTLTNMTIDGAAETFLLDDLRAALGDYLERDATAVHVIGGRRRAPPNCNLPFERIQVWCKVRMQLKSYHEQCLEPSQVIHTQPPSEAWPHGCYDAVIVNVDPKFKWPHSHLEGFFHFFFFIFVIFSDNSFRTLHRSCTLDFPSHYSIGIIQYILCLCAAFRYCCRGSGCRDAHRKACSTLQWSSYWGCDTSEQDCISCSSHSSFRTTCGSQTYASN